MEGEIPTTWQLPSVTQRRPHRTTPILGMIPKLQRGMQLLETPSRLQSEQILVGLAYGRDHLGAGTVPGSRQIAPTIANLLSHLYQGFLGRSGGCDDRDHALNWNSGFASLVRSEGRDG